MPPFDNAVLNAIGEATAARLTDAGARLDLASKDTLYDEGDAVDWVYFPEGALISTINLTQDGQLTETGMVGYEGALGLMETLGSRRMSASCVVQVDGPAWRIPAQVCRSVLQEGGPLMTAVLAQLEFQLLEARQAALCRSFHPAEARLARWLLECRDRCRAKGELPMTQEFLAGMLGVRRTTVTAFAGELQHRELIRYSRGNLTFLDIAGLEETACECRAVLVDARARISGQANTL